MCEWKWWAILNFWRLLGKSSKKTRYQNIVSCWKTFQSSDLPSLNTENGIFALLQEKAISSFSLGPHIKDENGLILALQVFIFSSWECFHVCLTTLFIWHQLRGLCVALCRNGFHYPPQAAFTSPQLPTIVADMECIICTLRLQNTFLQRPCYKRMYNYNRWRWIKWIDGEYTWLLLIRELK